ncbi:hypothetical protein Cgig2_003583 [Carnegiea gigantea]|uniref:Uncharacterized protein n=1 Tax=Carnegiea gigantea TaxID=171969 RepID=A0A9Q1JG09_9CARY|nr:hypothetical protein Cgig2_003583 [Carnegiea gigantea]
MAEYVIRHFTWDRLRFAFPPLPLQKDFQALYPSYELAVAKEAVAMEVARRYAHDSQVPYMVPVIFYGMIIDDAAELGLSHRLTMNVVMWAMRKLEWSPVEAWLEDNDQRLQRAQASHPADSPANPVLADGPSRGRTSSFLSFRDTVQAVEYVMDNLRWSKRETLSLCPNLLPWNCSAYYPEFSHIVAM